MTAKSEFDQNEWELISEGPVTAGMIVLTSTGGGSFRESFALARAYADARSEHGKSELLDEIVAAKPSFDRHRYHSNQELHDTGLDRLEQAAGVLRDKASAQELDDYRAFVLALATKVAEAHKEGGQEISPPEQAVLDDVRSRLGGAEG